MSHSESNFLTGTTDHCVVKGVATCLTITFFISHYFSHWLILSWTACCESLCSGLLVSHKDFIFKRFTTERYLLSHMHADVHTHTAYSDGDNETE